MLFGFVTSAPSLYIAGAATGIFVLAAPTALLVVIGETYPTSIRSTGVENVHPLIKIKKILGPLAGGALQTFDFSLQQFFALFALPCFFCAAVVFLYRTKNKGDTLDEV